MSERLPYARSLLRLLAQLHNLRNRMQEYEEQQQILQQKISKLQKSRLHILQVIDQSWHHELRDLQKLAKKLRKVAPELHEEECFDLLARKRLQPSAEQPEDESSTGHKRRKVAL